MLNVTVENIGELAVVECEGRIVQSAAAPQHFWLERLRRLRYAKHVYRPTSGVQLVPRPNPWPGQRSHQRS